MSPEVRRLDYWEEAIGPLNELEDKEGIISAKIGKVRMVLPLELEEQIRPHIGKRISVLRTDIPDKEYLIRFVSNEDMDRR